MDIVSELPVELARHIFSFLRAEDTNNCAMIGCWAERVPTVQVVALPSEVRSPLGPEARDTQIILQLTYAREEEEALRKYDSRSPSRASEFGRSQDAHNAQCMDGNLLVVQEIEDNALDVATLELLNCSNSDDMIRRLVATRCIERVRAAFIADSIPTTVLGRLRSVSELHLSAAMGDVYNCLSASAAFNHGLHKLTLDVWPDEDVYKRAPRDEQGQSLLSGVAAALGFESKRSKKWTGLQYEWDEVFELHSMPNLRVVEFVDHFPRTLPARDRTLATYWLEKHILERSSGIEVIEGMRSYVPRDSAALCNMCSHVRRISLADDYWLSPHTLRSILRFRALKELCVRGGTWMDDIALIEAMNSHWKSLEVSDDPPHVAAEMSRDMFDGLEKPVEPVVCDTLERIEANEMEDQAFVECIIGSCPNLVSLGLAKIELPEALRQRFHHSTVEEELDGREQRRQGVTQGRSVEGSTGQCDSQDGLKEERVDNGGAWEREMRDDFDWMRMGTPYSPQAQRELADLMASQDGESDVEDGDNGDIGTVAAEDPAGRSSVRERKRKCSLQ